MSTSSAAGTSAEVPVHTGQPLPTRVMRQLGDQADLLGTWWPTVALGALAVGIVVVLLVYRRRARRALRGAGWATAALAALLAVATGVNTSLAYFSSAEAVATWVTGRVTGAEGSVTQVSVPLRAGSGLDPTQTWVYTPPGYAAAAASGTRYPVVYVLHGEPGSSADWFSAGGLAHTVDVLTRDGLIPPAIYVAPDLTAPDTDDTECLDSTLPGGPQVETHLLDTVSWVDAHYSTRADADHRVVAGMSMGGFCALDQGLRHQDLFGAIVGIEPFGDPGDGGRALLATQAQFEAVSPSSYDATVPRLRRQPVYLDNAESGDPASARDARAVADVLSARGWPVYRRAELGFGHSWAMASVAIAPALVWTFSELRLTRTTSG